MIEETFPQTEPLVFTTKGNIPLRWFDPQELKTPNMPVASRVQHWEHAEEYTKMVDCWILGDEIVKQEVHVYARTQLIGKLLAGQVG